MSVKKNLAENILFKKMFCKKDAKHIHFIGIGGIGMSGMAELLLKLGFNISGSDKSLSEKTDQLSKLGIQIHKGHCDSNIKNCDVVVSNDHQVITTAAGGGW